MSKYVLILLLFAPVAFAKIDVDAQTPDEHFQQTTEGDRLVLKMCGVPIVLLKGKDGHFTAYLGISLLKRLKGKIETTDLKDVYSGFPCASKTKAENQGKGGWM